MLQDNEKLVVDVLKFLIDSSCIKMDASVLITPSLKRKEVCKSPTAPAKRITKISIPNKGELNVDAKVLFPEVELDHVTDGPALNHATDGPIEDDCDVVFVKEVILNDKLNKMSNHSYAMYNSNIGVGSIVDNGAAVNEERHKDIADLVSISESARFPLTPQLKMVYNAMFSLAKTNLSRSILVNIGKCNLTYKSLAESMTPGKEVSSYVINVFCRKFFLDERPNISRKHYFFSQVSDVFLSQSADYSSVERSFSGAAKVLKLQECDSLFFPVFHKKHWFLFVVDLQRNFYMILDSLYSKDDEFSTDTRKKLIEGFLNGWALFVNLNTSRFDNFKVGYLNVPKQENEADSGIFLIKFMELYGNCARLTDEFSAEDIPSIRVKIVDNLVYSDHNIADKSPLNNLISLSTLRH